MTTICEGEPNVAAVAAVFADRRRARILMALAAGRRLSAGQLAREAGVSASTASSHLAALLRHELVTVTVQGRHRYYTLATPQVERVLEALATIAPRQPITSLREHNTSQALSDGRTCDGHLAGRVGVQLFRDMIRRGWIATTVDHSERAPAMDAEPVSSEVGPYRLTDRGAAVLLASGVPAAVLSTSSPLHHCLDWTEHAPHLAGALGRAIAVRLFELGAVARGPVPRSVLHQPAHGALLVDRLSSSC